MTVVVPPFFWEFLEYVQDGGDPMEFNPFGSNRPKNRAQKRATNSLPGRSVSRRIPLPKKKRKVSRYQKVYGKHLKALKRKHPRTNISVLMKKAHRLTKKELK